MTEHVVVPELLAVIGDHDHERIREPSRAFEVRQNRTQLTVEIVHLGVVKALDHIPIRTCEAILRPHRLVRGHDVGRLVRAEDALQRRSPGVIGRVGIIRCRYRKIGASDSGGSESTQASALRPVSSARSERGEEARDGARAEDPPADRPC